jgi:hypothetical protein
MNDGSGLKYLLTDHLGSARVFGGNMYQKYAWTTAVP